jgi:hypothetical protein
MFLHNFIQFYVLYCFYLHSFDICGLYVRDEPIPVAEWSKARVCGWSPAGIAGSNPAGGMDVCLL